MGIRVFYLSRFFEVDNGIKDDDILNCSTSAVQVQGECVGPTGKETIVRRPVYEYLSAGVTVTLPVDRYIYVFALPKTTPNSICSGDLSLLVSCNFPASPVIQRRIRRHFHLTPEQPVADIPLHAGPFARPQCTDSSTTPLFRVSVLFLILAATLLAAKCLLLPGAKLRTKQFFQNDVQKRKTSYAFMKGQKVNLPRDQFTPWEKGPSEWTQPPAIFLCNGAKLLSPPKPVLS